MRIITGRARGKKLASADGLTTRPTGSRVKEAIFSIVQFDIEGRVVLDLFAGSGQMGLEALSRGAKSCVFAEIDRKAIEIIRKNIKLCGFESECRLETRPALEVIAKQPKGGAGLIFLDPPYASDLARQALEAIERFDILAAGGIIVLECASDTAVFAVGAPYFLRREYLYGGTKVLVYSRE